VRGAGAAASPGAGVSACVTSMTAARAEPVEAGEDDDCRAARGRRLQGRRRGAHGARAAGVAARGATGGGGARMGTRAGPSPHRDWVGVEKLGSGGWVGGDRWIESRVGGWLGLVLLWATGLHGLIIVLRSGLIRVLGVYT